MISQSKIEIVAIVYEKNELNEPVTGGEIAKIRDTLTSSAYPLIDDLVAHGVLEKIMSGRKNLLRIKNTKTAQKVAEACWILTKFNNNGKELTLQKAR